MYLCIFMKIIVKQPIKRTVDLIDRICLCVKNMHTVDWRPLLVAVNVIVAHIIVVLCPGVGNFHLYK